MNLRGRSVRRATSLPHRTGSGSQYDHPVPDPTTPRDHAREVERLVYTYAERIDAGDLAGVGDLFASGRLVAGPGVVIEGAHAVRKLYEQSTRIHSDGTPRTRHVTTNVIVDVDAAGTTASSRSTYTVFQQTDDLPLQPIISGRYRDLFVLDGGAWRFEEREILVDLTGDLSQHLLFEL